VLRFNSQQEISENHILVDMPVYYAPNLPFTSYVFTSHLMAMRGSDASWKHDNEPPDDVKEYSDDEEERRDRTRNQRNKRKQFA
jgi:H/ACA ribonucleoprotein complex non-core subunit NAF1